MKFWNMVLVWLDELPYRLVAALSIVALVLAVLK